MGRASKHKKSKKNKGMVILVVVLLIIILAAGVVLYMKYKNSNNKEGQDVAQEPEEDVLQIITEDEIEVYKTNIRPIAVMIDNHKDAWPQAGLNDAYAVYEIIVEGGETRMMALFKEKDVEKIGPVRSSRHYFLDYALENDAIYAHYGWSPQAESDIKSLKVNNINGITESSKLFWRIKQKAAPHNVLTSTKLLRENAKSKNYRTTTDSKSVLNYTSSEVNLENGTDVNKVTIPYSTLHTTSYEYDSETKTYIRYARGKKQTDFITSEPIRTKNIIITFAENYTLNDPENKDRQGLKNIGTKKGYYITNGKAIEITCTKDSRTSKTVYKDMNGNEIKVNDGNTFFNICPTDSDVKFE